MNYELRKMLAVISILPLTYALGYYKGKKKGEGMIKLANSIQEHNCKQVNALNLKIREVNRAMNMIKEWEREHSEEF